MELAVIFCMRSGVDGRADCPSGLRPERFCPTGGVLRRCLVMGVDGMTCQNCQRHVENALNVMPGTWAAVDLAAQNVTILTKDEADEDAIRQAIHDAGYLPLRTTSKV